MYPCVCCGYLTLTEAPDNHEICPICFWEDDGLQLAQPELVGGSNHVSLLEAQANFEKTGAADARLVPLVRRPTPGDKREPGWRRIDLRLDDFDSEKDRKWPEDPTVLYWWRPASQLSRHG